MQATSAGPASRPRILLAAPLLPLAIAFAIACGDGSNGGADTASPTPADGASPTGAATATPMPGTPAPTAEPTPPPEPTPTPTPQVNVTPVDPFDVQTAEAINIRDRPSTDGNITVILFPGETATVTGEAQGEAVEAGDTTWYRVDITKEGTTSTGYLYAAYVARVQ